MFLAGNVNDMLTFTKLAYLKNRINSSNFGLVPSLFG